MRQHRWQMLLPHKSLQRLPKDQLQVDQGCFIKIFEDFSSAKAIKTLFVVIVVLVPVNVIVVVPNSVIFGAVQFDKCLMIVDCA